MWTSGLANKILIKWREFCKNATDTRVKIIANQHAFTFLINLFDKHVLNCETTELTIKQHLDLYKSELHFSEKSAGLFWLSEAFELQKSKLQRKILKEWSSNTESIRKFKYKYK